MNNRNELQNAYDRLRATLAQIEKTEHLHGTTGRADKLRTQAIKAIHQISKTATEKGDAQ